jgi:hypothetical protein
VNSLSGSKNIRDGEGAVMNQRIKPEYFIGWNYYFIIILYD